MNTHYVIKLAHELSSSQFRRRLCGHFFFENFGSFVKRKGCPLKAPPDKIVHLNDSIKTTSSVEVAYSFEYFAFWEKFAALLNGRFRRFFGSIVRIFRSEFSCCLSVNVLTLLTIILYNNAVL